MFYSLDPKSPNVAETEEMWLVTKFECYCNEV